MNLMVFSKHLQGPPLRETAQKLRAMGVDAIDLTVRPGGHVEPARVEDDLPRAISDLAAEGVRVGMLTTNITSAADPVAEPTLRIAAAHGIPFYKLGYYDYQGFGTHAAQGAEVRAKVRDLAAMNSAIGICGGFHNHSGNVYGASLWDIANAIEDTDPQFLGVYLDPAHAVIEGGIGGWIQGMDVIRDRIVMLALKDFRWEERADVNGVMRPEVIWHPLGSGFVPWDRVISCLAEVGFDGPISMHSEYQGGHSFKDLTTDEVLQQTAVDLPVFRALASAAGL